MDPIVGMAVSAAGSIDLAIDRAVSFGCTTMQTFVSSPMVWRVKAMGDAEARAFREKAAASKISPTVIHMLYLANFASPDKAVYKKSVEALEQNIDRCNAIGADYLVLHLGSDLGQGKEAGMQRVMDAVAGCADLMHGKLLLENQAGNANSVGSDLKDLHALHKGIASKRVGYCIDTCHAFAAGYDIRKREVMEQIAREISLAEIDVIHINDSKFDLGSGRDRHERLGAGYIGIEGFRNFIGFRDISKKALILETPTDRDGDEPVGEVSRLRSLALGK